MRRFTTSAASAIGGLVLLAVPAVAAAQGAAHAAVAVPRAAAVEVGSVRGLVHDERGTPVAGAMVSAVGPITAFAVTGDSGRFDLAGLPAGVYLLRVHQPGYASPRGQRLDVAAGGFVSSSIAIRRLPDGTAPLPLVEAGIGGAAASTTVLDRLEDSLRSDAAEGSSSGTAADGAAAPADAAPETASDEDELTWYLRHMRRSILKDGVTVALVSDRDDPAQALARETGSPVRMATDFLAMPFTGQVNLLTTGTLDGPQQLFDGDNQLRGITYAAVGAPAGRDADWTVRGALTDGDLTSWIVAGTYLTRPGTEGRHRYDVRLSYSTERYDGGNPEALRAVADGSRNAGIVSAFDTLQVNRRLAVTYGAGYSHYDYLDGRNLLSPRVSAVFTPMNRTRLTTLVARRAVAPGAEEFVPPLDGVWLPPQRTFSPAAPDGRLSAEQATHLDVGVERDLKAVTLTARTYRQQIQDQLVTMFGPDLPDRPATDIGHYFVGAAGDVDVSGWAAGVRTAIADRVTGSVEYSVSRATWYHGDDIDYLVVLAPSVARPRIEHVHDVSTKIETDVPETDTRVLVVYRLSDGFSSADGGRSPALDSRFDVQVRQSLPFMDFSTARWEMLVGVRNFFRDPMAEQSVYDELLVVKPPKRIIGGLTVRF
jgi:hypothetical protein